MNRFTDQYGDGIRRFWDNTATDTEKVKLLADILAYANKHPQQFKIELKEVLFDADIDPLSVVLEALSKDTDNWGDFFVEILQHIFDAAYATTDADSILFNLTEFYYIENDTRPFVQKIADKLLAELDSPRPDIRATVIKHIPGYINNPTIKNTTAIVNKLTEKLNDENWKVRCVAHQYLGFENLLPGGAKLRLSDKLSKLIFGRP